MVTTSYDKYFFGDVGRETYDFFWGDFADWYVCLMFLAVFSMEFGIIYIISSIRKFLSLLELELELSNLYNLSFQKDGCLTSNSVQDSTYVFFSYVNN